MIITKTPLRISFLGGNTDFKEYYYQNPGLVLTTTIDKYIYCIVKQRFDDLIVVNYSIKEIVEDVNDLKHELVREALKLVGVMKGLEITFLADIPTQGTGLGSSSAVTVGVLNALHQYLGDSVGAMQLAEEAVRIEIDILYKPIGVQDQYAVALGGLRSILMTKQEIKSERIAIAESVREDFNNSLMLFYTDITRKTEDILGSFDVSKHKILLDHNAELANDGIVALKLGNLKRFAELLDEYWQMKKEANDKVSNMEIDAMYGKAKAVGAVGGKVIGAGGGGFLLVMFSAHKRAAISNALHDYRELPFRFGYDGSKVIVNL